MRRLLILIAALAASGGWGNQDAGHMLLVRIPLVLQLQVKELGLRVDALAPHPSLVLQEGHYTLKVVANTTWSLEMEGLPYPASLLHGRGVQEFTLIVPPGVEVRLALRPRG